MGVQEAWWVSKKRSCFTVSTVMRMSDIFPYWELSELCVLCDLFSPQKQVCLDPGREGIWITDPVFTSPTPPQRWPGWTFASLVVSHR